MADKLVISDDLKIGKEEILLDPTKTGLKCGKEVSALTLNDLMYVKENSMPVNALDYIKQLIDNKIQAFHVNDNNNSNNASPITIIYE